MQHSNGSSHSSEYESTKRWAIFVGKWLLVGYLVMQIAAFAMSRVAIFYTESARVADRLRHADKACWDKCIVPKVIGEGEDVVNFCRDICELAHSGMSPTMEGLRAVADSTYLCGSRPCLESFGLYRILMVIGVLYLARELLAYSVTATFMGSELKRKKLA